MAARRARGVLLHVGTGDRWSGPLRISVGIGILHASMGERLWVGPPEPSREGEGLWFSQGVARHLSRDLQFRYGLLSAAEVASEVNGLEATLATAPRRREGNAALGARRASPA